ncbi:putative High mobility group protein DSP1 [Hypsibius exemplaris]|uniref:High mobility group protein DSP1 n=1 Tax=Hypsibius exemplaris TaxID=2072580 RepID=A0A1W0W9G2_HYPEX|nr:putative High mobility group protein DSP1 [Hypsibius exemplaris]
MSAYNLFQLDYKKILKDKGISAVGEFSKETGAKWRALDEATKQRYKDKAKELKPSEEQKSSKKVDTKPRGKKSAYFFFIDECRKKHKLSKSKQPYQLGEAGAKWKAMDKKARKPYEDLALADRDRHGEEMMSYIPDGSDSRKRTFSTIAPKKAQSAFLLFCTDETPAVEAILGHSRDTVLKVATELGKRWGKLGREARTRYDELAAKDAARYDKELKEHEGALKSIAGGPGPKKGPAVQHAIPPADVFEDDTDDIGEEESEPSEDEDFEVDEEPDQEEPEEE